MRAIPTITYSDPSVEPADETAFREIQEIILNLN